MRKVMLVLLITACFMSVSAENISSISRDNISVCLDGIPVAFDVSPFLSDNRVLAPVRAIADTCGALVEWDDETKTAYIKDDNLSVSFVIGNRGMTVNGEYHEIDTAATIVSGRTFVPLRALTEIFGLTVEWDGETTTVLLSTENQFLLPVTYYVESEASDGCVLACKAMVISNFFDKPFSFEQLLDANEGSTYVQWAPEFSFDLSFETLMESELLLKEGSENFTVSGLTVEEKMELIKETLPTSTGIIAQFSNGKVEHGVVITGYTAEGELIMCDPNTASDHPENTLLADSCLAGMFKLYTTEEILPYLVSMRYLVK